MKQLAFTERAAHDLEDILTYTVTNFGTDQAEVYKNLLLERSYDIAASRIDGRNCSLLMGPSSRTHLLYCPAGQHFIVYLDDSDAINVIAILHQSSDLPRHLEILAGGLK